MPKFTFQTVDSIPEELRGEAKQGEGGKFEIELVSASFRQKNIDVSRERDQLQTVVTAFKTAIGEDPNAVVQELTELRAVNQSVKDGKLKGTEQIEAEVARRTEGFKSEMQTQIKAQSERAADFETKFSASEAKRKSMLVKQAIAAAVMDPANGANPQAIADFEARGLSMFRVKDDDTLVAMQGDAVVYGTDGATPMSPKEWLAKVLKDSPYLAKGSNGGGAGGDLKGKGVFGGMDEKSWNALSPAEKLRQGRKAAGQTV